MVRPHYNLLAWKSAMALVEDVYTLTGDFPKEEMYGLTSQMRRAAVSIPSNLTEGAARNGTKEFVQFLGVAKGSLIELETQLLISAELGYLSRDHGLFEEIEEVSRLIAGLQKSVRTAD
ncbi:MAG: four helix bundle protein [Betaproteobacteria bacterium]